MDYKCIKIFEPEALNVVKGLRVADCMNRHDINSNPQENEVNSLPYNLKELAISDVLTCSYCSVSFADAIDQRSHYKLDWHRYNLKRALSGNKPVPEDVFATLADDVSSISGSDSESSSEDPDTDISESIKSFQSENVRHRFKTVRHIKAFFENEANEILSVHKCLIHTKKESLVKEDLVTSVFELVQKPKKWMIVMLGGGHFAAAIFLNDVIVNHKTFHCYTVRAKQGGSQSTRDNKGGSHPKSAGASLRRYNEQALVQHVREILTAWSEQLKDCNLILYRAPGPYNRGVLFGGKKPLLPKTDPRLRNIPFPTRRATFKEVKRVHDMLSSIEVYGSADDFKEDFPHSPDKRTWSPRSKKSGKSGSSDCDASKDTEPETEKAQIEISLPEICQSGRSPQRYISTEEVKESSESGSEGESDFELFSNDLAVDFDGLKEFDDTVPQRIKDLRKRIQEQRKRKKKSYAKQKAKLEKRKWNEEFERIHGNLVKSCRTGDKQLLEDSLKIYDTLPERSWVESEESQKLGSTFTKEDFIDCLNAAVIDETRNTLLHLAAVNCLPEFITLLMTAGADPTVKNKNKLTPYVIAGNKETRNSFRSFAVSYPDKYDMKKANIPEPLSEDLEKELKEKKKEKRKLKREREKIKKQEDKEKRNEEVEKQKFLALSDREKCALAAERRFLASSTSKQPVLSRCFQCGLDITGKVPFEYGNNRFCTIPCLKAHRLKTNSYGVQI